MKKALLAATLLFAVPLSPAQTVVDPNLTVDVVIRNLALPIAMEFLRNDSVSEFFVTERFSGRVKLVRNGAVAGIVLDLAVNTETERGLLGMTKHPDFETNGFIYLFYSPSTQDAGPWMGNRVSRFRWNGTALVDELIILDVLPDPDQMNGPIHHGGILLFGPDRKLYGVTGDLNRGKFSNPRIEQNTDADNPSGVGGIFRYNDDGSIPDDNPFVDHSSPHIQRLFAYGIRNSFGLSFDPLTGRLWETENSPVNYDEINVIDKGFNGGWIKIMGPDARNAAYSENGQRNWDAHELIHLPGSYYGDPKFSWTNPVPAVTSIAFARSARYDPGVIDEAIVGDWNNSALYLFPMNAQRNGFNLTGPLADLVADGAAERDLSLWGTGWRTSTDMDIGADGYIYCVNYINGLVVRIRPVNSPTVINGEASLADFGAHPLNVPLRLDIYQNDALVETIDTQLDAFGKFSVRAQTTGAIKVVAKPSHWLSVARDSLALSSGGHIYLKLNFAYNGDVNGDNVIDDTDLSLILTAFGVQDDDIDQNGDGLVDDVDLSIVLTNFGQAGQE